MRRLQRGHPLNVFPLGNAFLDDQAQIRRNQGLGPQLVRLGDESLLQLLRWLDLETLGRCCRCSCMLRGFAAAEELWQPLVMAKFLASAGSEEVKERGFSWKGRTWREAYVLSRGAAVGSQMPRIYSDVLYRGFFYAATELNPSWLEAETLQRVGAELTTSEFVERFEEQSCPVIVEGCVKHWPALSRWSRETLVQRYGDVPFAAGAADFPLETFYAYAENNTDDVPMFIFDKYWRARGLLEDYEVPLIFRDRDLFHYLGERRPDFRWLLIGNQRSGSKWHLDPNKTCAWNAVVRGRKRWLLLPPGCPPPGVHPSKDGGEVTQPVSLLEWFSNFYEELKRHVEANPAWELKEGTCGPGDLVFIPSGWWHCVLNLEDDTIAVTQNYASETHVSSVRRFLKEKRDQVSGFISARDRESFAERFDEALSRFRPDLLKVTADPEPKVDASKATVKSGGFSFWDHLRSTGKSLSFESEERHQKRQRV